MISGVLRARESGSVSLVHLSMTTELHVSMNAYAPEVVWLQTQHLRLLQELSLNVVILLLANEFICIFSGAAVLDS